MSLLVQMNIEELLKRNGDTISEESLKALARIIYERDEKLRHVIKYTDSFFVQTMEVTSATLSIEMVESLEDFRRSIHIICGVI